MRDVAPGPGTTSSRVRLPIDDVIDAAYAAICRHGGFYGPEWVLGYLEKQTPYVVAGVLRKHRAERGA